MFQKGPFVVEFFLIVESFGYDCTHKVWPFVDLISYESIFFFFSFGKWHYKTSIIYIHIV